MPRKKLNRETQALATQNAALVAKPLGLPNMLRAMLVESLYECQRNGELLHPLLLEAAERKRRILLMREREHEETQKIRRLQQELLRATINRITGKGNRGDKILLAMGQRHRLADLRSIYGIATKQDEAFLTDFYETTEQFPAPDATDAYPETA